MGARIMVETPHVRPVIDGKWHMTWLRNWPVPGAIIETLCGVSEPAEYGPADSAHVVVKTCWDCDLAWRKAMEVPWYGPDNHPALRQ